MTFQYFLFDTYIGYFILALPLAIIISIIYGLIKYKNDKETSLLKKITSCLFICYMVGLLELVIGLDFLRYIWYWLIFHMDSGIAPSFFNLDFNFIPDFWNHLNKEVIGNLVIFIPFGILYSLSRKELNLKKSILAGFLCSLIIELVQPIFGRAFDINDLILNTFGSLIGIAMYFAINKIVKKEK